MDDSAHRSATNTRLDALVRELTRVLEGRPEVAAAYLYGSTVTGRASPLSDVDVAILLAYDLSSQRRGTLLRELTLSLERTRPGATFDVRLLDELPTSIRGRVVTEGRRVLDRDPARRVAAEVRARMDYHDFLVFEREGTRDGLRGLRSALGDG